MAGRPDRPGVTGRAGSAGVPGDDRVARAVGDLPVRASRALVLPARRDRDRAADRVGRPRASPVPGRSGRRRAGRGGLRRDAVDRRGGQRPGGAVRDRRRAEAVDRRRARPAAWPGRGVFHRVAAAAVPVLGPRGTPATRRARAAAAGLVRPQPGTARRVRGFQRHRHRRGRAQPRQRAGEDRAAPVLRRAGPARRRRPAAPDARHAASPRARGHRTVADLRPPHRGADGHGGTEAADRRLRRPAGLRRQPPRSGSPTAPRPRPARDRGRPAHACGRAAGCTRPRLGRPTPSRTGRDAHPHHAGRIHRAGPRPGPAAAPPRQRRPSAAAGHAHHPAGRVRAHDVRPLPAGGLPRGRRRRLVRRRARAGPGPSRRPPHRRLGRRRHRARPRRGDRDGAGPLDAAPGRVGSPG